MRGTKCARVLRTGTSVEITSLLEEFGWFSLYGFRIEVHPRPINAISSQIVRPRRPDRAQKILPRRTSSASPGSTILPDVMSDRFPTGQGWRRGRHPRVHDVNRMTANDRPHDLGICGRQPDPWPHRRGPPPPLRLALPADPPRALATPSAGRCRHRGRGSARDPDPGVLPGTVETTRWRNGYAPGASFQREWLVLSIR